MLSDLKLLLNNLKLFNVKIDDRTCFQGGYYVDKMKKIIHIHVGKQIHIFNFRHCRIWYILVLETTFIKKK